MKGSLKRGLSLAALAVAAVLVRAPESSAQDMGGGMDRTGTVGIENETERLLFWSLICTCGCPRETLGTCTCGFAHERRGELRAELSAGKTIEQIQAAYAKRFGSQALAVPPASGAAQALYIAPLVAIVAGAMALLAMLKRWKTRGAAAEAAGGPKVAAASRDEYDARLDDELRDLDE